MTVAKIDTTVRSMPVPAGGGEALVRVELVENVED